MAYLGNILFSTTNAVSGYEIIDHKGIVFERVVSGVGLISELYASFTDVFGGRSERMEDQLDTLYTELFSAMARKVEKVGANAIVGFSIDIDEISGKGVSMLMISGTGTAVTVQPISRVTESKPARKKEEPWKCVKCGTEIRGNQTIVHPAVKNGILNGDVRIVIPIISQKRIIVQRVASSELWKKK